MDFIKNISTRFPILQKLEHDYKIPKEYSFLSIILLVLILIMSTPIGPIITSLTGVIVPLRETLLVLKQVNPNKDETRHLLIFWLVFGLLTSLDAYSRFITSFIPLFYTIKFLVLVYIGPFRFQGTKFIYDNFISKVPQEWFVGSDGVDKAVRKAGEVVNEGVGKIRDKKSD
ncbi:membrane traffic regulatory protein [Vairimorpha apis BRL 01]|uniref:Protein YOP1 n=1 Tax=Vairimorpha apis BRL 01 TaxID=1037528 RepID=T0L4I9_9MICR|nr:membrane traffic regulatory protein [Vairimorpha apis BRL 01]